MDPDRSAERRGGGISVINPWLLSGTEIRRLQIASGDAPCFGTRTRIDCDRADCRLARRCTGRLVAHWKR